jgi:trimeric autotransporter adhesin
MRFRGLAILCASSLSACDVPALSFEPPRTFSRQAYIKASNTGAGDRFGQSVALSDDGSTLAVGAFFEASRGANPDDNSAKDAGAVYVFVRSGSGWVQQKYIKSANIGTDDWFGSSVALSADGSTLAVGAMSEDSKGTGNTADPADNSAPASGAVYVFTRTGTDWSQQAYLKASNTEAADQFGASVALSADGSTLAVGAITEFGNGTSQSDNNAREAGAVYVFTRTDAMWSVPVYVKPATVVAFDRFGSSLALSQDGATLAVGIQRPASFGKAYVFARSGATWTEQFKAEASGSNSGFGTSVALSGDGSLLAVGAARESSPTTGAGTVYVYTRNDGVWSTLPARLIAPNAGEGDGFGDTVALSAAGTLLAVGATSEDSKASGFGGDPFDDSASDAGAVYLFTRGDAAWTQHAYLKSSNTGAGDGFGHSLAVSPDGSTLVVGTTFEDSNATGVNGDDKNDAAVDSGAVYVLE